MPPVPEQAVLGDAHSVQQRCLVVRVCCHLYSYLHHHPSGKPIPSALNMGPVNLLQLFMCALTLSSCLQLRQLSQACLLGIGVKHVCSACASSNMFSAVAISTFGLDCCLSAWKQYTTASVNCHHNVQQYTFSVSLNNAPQNVVHPCFLGQEKTQAMNSSMQASHVPFGHSPPAPC